MSVIPTKQARLVGYAETGTPEWFAMRRGKITGSRIAACIGLSPWVSRFNLYHQMVGLASEDVDEDAAPWIHWGRLLEPLVVGQWAQQHPNTKVRRRASVWQNIERPWQQVSPDALAVEPGVGSARRPATAIIEAKTSLYRDHWGAPGTDDIPVYYRCQIIWMLDTLGLEYCYVPVLFGGSDYQEYLVRYDESDALILRAAAREMLDMVERQERPDIDAHSATYELIRSFHPEITNETVELPPDLVAQADIAVSQMREAEDTLLTVRSTLAEFMGRAKKAEYQGRKIADRRARGAGRPYVQIAGPSQQPTIQEAAAS